MSSDNNVDYNIDQKTLMFDSNSNSSIVRIQVPATVCNFSAKKIQDFHIKDIKRLWTIPDTPRDSITAHILSSDISNRTKLIPINSPLKKRVKNETSVKDSGNRLMTGKVFKPNLTYQTLKQDLFSKMDFIYSNSNEAKMKYPYRVFALLRDGKNYYYPATIIKHVKESKKTGLGSFMVRFESGLQDVVQQEYIRFFIFEKGDQIHISKDGKFSQGTVLKCDNENMDTDLLGLGLDAFGNNQAYIRLRSGKEQIFYLNNEFYITSKVINYKFSNRHFNTSDKELLVDYSVYDHSLKKPGLFENIIFAITISNNKRSLERDKITQLIRNNGGQVVEEDFQELFIQISNNLDMIQNIWENAYLVSDDYTRKIKYLQALALGISCIPYAAISESVNAGKLLLGQRLAAGYSDLLYATISQHTTDKITHTLVEKIRDRIKIFHDIKVIIFSAIKDTTKAHLFLAKAMGASDVLHIKKTSQFENIINNYSKIKTIVLSDKNNIENKVNSASGKSKNIHYKSFEWMIQCLILGSIHGNSFQ